MALVVEDGSGVEGAQSYLDVSGFKKYADARALVYTGTDPVIEAALIRATAWLDASYRSRWPGTRVYGRDQRLAWPRSGVTDADDEEIAEGEIPQEVLDAAAEAAVRELASPGSLAPDLERGGAIRRVQAGSVSVEYASTATAGTTFSLIDGLLAGLLVGGGETNVYAARAVRA